MTESLLNLVPRRNEIMSTLYRSSLSPSSLHCCHVFLSPLYLASSYSLPPYLYPLCHHGGSKIRSINGNNGISTKLSSHSPSVIATASVYIFISFPETTLDAFSDTNHQYSTPPPPRLLLILFCIFMPSPPHIFIRHLPHSITGTILPPPVHRRIFQ